MAAPAETEVSHEHIEDLLKRNAWMIRSCEIYHDEYKECKSLRARFHQYYTLGENAYCETWKADHGYCLDYRKSKSKLSAAKLILHEQERRKTRLQAAKENDIWEYRTKAPADWNKPLPDYLARNKLPSIQQSESASMCVIS